MPTLEALELRVRELEDKLSAAFEAKNETAVKILRAQLDTATKRLNTAKAKDEAGTA